MSYYLFALKEILQGWKLLARQKGSCGNCSKQQIAWRLAKDIISNLYK